MVTTRRSRGGSEPAELDPAPSVEDVLDDVEAAVDDAEIAAELADAEAGAEVPEANAMADQAEPIVAEQTTVITQPAPDEILLETTESAPPADAGATAVTVEEGGSVPDHVVQDAIKEAVQTAEATAAATGEPAVAQTTIELAPAADEAAAAAAAAADPVAAPVAEPSADPVTDAVLEGGSAAPENGSVGVISPAATAKPASSFRLFVGCVPHQFREEDLRPYFDEIAPVREITVLRDQMTGSSRGCAFAIFGEKDHADAAIEKLDKKFTLPGAVQPIEVRYARESNKIQPAAEPNDKNQLFYARAPISATEQDVRELFAGFGEVTEVALFMNRAAGVSKGCGFVFFKDKANAQAAIDALHDKKTMTGGFTPLTVKWADPNLNEKKRKAAEDAMDPNRDNTQIFFARIPKSISEDTIRQVFESVGAVKELVLFKTHQAATINKGCGIVTMQTHEDATRALDQLDNVHVFEGMDVAMVLKWVDQDLQKRRKMEREPGGFGAPPPGWQGGPPMFGGGPPMGMAGGQFGGGPMGEEERPPPGCDRDSFKLYLAGVPKSWELPDLKRVVEKYGQIIDMNLVRDKVTKEPRGVAFMWFRTKMQAEAAIRDLNNQSFDDGFGGKRTIQISKAKPRRNPSMGGPPGGGPPQMSPGMYGRGPGGFQGGYQQPRPPVQPPAYQQPAPPYYQQPQQQAAPAYDPYGAAAAQPQQQAYGGYQAAAYQQPQPPSYSYQQPQAQAPQMAAYQQQAPQQVSGYQQAYNPPTAAGGGYGTAAAAAGPQYVGATGYEAQPQQQQAYATQQYAAAPSAAPQQGSYNYAAQATAAPQGAYGAAAAPNTAPSAGQYTYAAAGQVYGDTSGYNYGPPTS